MYRRRLGNDVTKKRSEVETLRRFTGFLFTMGALGAGTELLLLGHIEDTLQLVPLVLLGLGLLALVGLWLRPRPSTLRVFRALMVFFTASGFVGLYLHYRANSEFELEMYPSLAGLDLVWESLTGATPALAPATMAYLGLLGMASTYRHPGGGMS